MIYIPRSLPPRSLRKMCRSVIDGSIAVRYLYGMIMRYGIYIVYSVSRVVNIQLDDQFIDDRVLSWWSTTRSQFAHAQPVLTGATSSGLARNSL